jgi:hypothetical protein
VKGPGAPLRSPGPVLVVVSDEKIRRWLVLRIFQTVSEGVFSELERV